MGKKGEPVCIDDEIPFDIPDSWEWCTLGNILSVKGGKRVPKGYKLLDEPTPHIYIRVTNMKNGTIEKNNIKYIDSKVHEQIKNYTIGKDDLYITVAGTIGKVGVVPDYFDGMNLTENANKLTDISINKSFLKYVLMSDYIQSQLLDKTTQVAQPKLAIKRIILTKIAIPPLNEQKRIINEINKLNPLINEYDINEKKLDKLNSEFPDKLKSSILQEAIQGKLVPQDLNDEPASVLLERIRNEKERLIKEKKIKRNKNESYIFKENNHFYEMTGKNEPICIDDEIPFEIPDNWVWTRIKNISEFVTKGTTPKGGKSAYINEGIKFLRVENIGKNGELILDNIKYIDEDIHENFLKRSILKENDLLISIAGALGRTAIIPKDALPLNTNQAVSLVRWFNTDYIFVPFIEKAINSPEIQKLLLKQSKITAIPNLTLEIIRECLIPFPPLPEQRKIVNKINCLFEELF